MYNSYLSSVLAYSLILLPCRSYIYYDECTNPLFLMLEIPHIVSSPNIFIPISVFRKVLKSFFFIYNCPPLLILYFLNPFWATSKVGQPISARAPFRHVVMEPTTSNVVSGISKTLYEIFLKSLNILTGLYITLSYFI